MSPSARQAVVNNDIGEGTPEFLRSRDIKGEGDDARDPASHAGTPGVYRISLAHAFRRVRKLVI